MKVANLETVVSNNACVGCGACAFQSNSQMQFNKFGEYIPCSDLLKNTETKVLKSCPSLHPELNEDVLSDMFLSNDIQYFKGLGKYDKIYAGHVTEGNYRSSGTSGGTGTWLGAKMLDSGLIDGVIHVKEVKRNDALSSFFEYAISESVEDAIKGSKTRYHVTELSNILHDVGRKEGRFLFIGVPCMVKAVRRLQLQDEELKRKIAFTISLVCGHMKSVNWTLSLAWAAGVSPEHATKFQYRTKGKDIPARAYVYTAHGVKDKNEISVIKDSAKVVGGKFNIGALMLPACELCDDVVGETADVTIGDAWLPRFEADNSGNNLVIVRNPEISFLIEEARKKGNLTYTEISPQEAFESQAGGFRQRGEGLSHRLSEREKMGVWSPKKRIDANSIKVSLLRKKIYSMRSELTSQSRILFVDALTKNDYSIYDFGLKLSSIKLRRLELFSVFFKALKNRLMRLFYKFFRGKS